MLGKFTGGIKKTAQRFSAQFSKILLPGRKIDEKILEEIEEALIAGDIGVENSALLIDKIRKNARKKDLTLEEVEEIMVQTITEILTPFEGKFSLQTTADEPYTIIMAGVNGNGKTTTLGKFAYLWKNQGKKILIAACDTYRAASVEQLTTWAERANSPLYQGAPNSDPASVAYKSFKKAKDEDYDILLVDTSGRMQNNQALLDELAKICNVISKQDENAPHEVIIVIDATTGQHANIQLEEFSKKINITGIIITKLDGTAKAGILVSICQKWQLPVIAIGIGEKIEDLKEFSAAKFAKNLFAER